MCKNSKLKLSKHINNMKIKKIQGNKFMYFGKNTKKIEINAHQAVFHVG